MQRQRTGKQLGQVRRDALQARKAGTSCPSREGSFAFRRASPGDAVERSFSSNRERASSRQKARGMSRKTPRKCDLAANSALQRRSSDCAKLLGAPFNSAAARAQLGAEVSRRIPRRRIARVGPNSSRSQGRSKSRRCSSVGPKSAAAQAPATAVSPQQPPVPICELKTGNWTVVAAALEQPPSRSMAPVENKRNEKGVAGVAPRGDPTGENRRPRRCDCSL